MTWGEVAALLTAVGVFTSAMTGIASVWLISRSAKVIEEVRHNTNSLTEELVKLTGEAAYAEGVKDQKAEDEQ